LICIFIVWIIDDVFIFSYVLIQSTIKFLTNFILDVTIRKTLFRVISLFFWMIDWSIIKFFTYKTLFRTTCLKFIDSITKFISTIRWFISSLSTILSVNEILIIDFIFVLLILMLLLYEEFSNDLVISNTELQNIAQSRHIHWWVDQLEYQSWMISACSNDVFS
jgi:hypothetical protein